jgi:prevent-host-death family protein
MATMSMTNARKYFEELVARVEKGETVTLTRWGKPVVDIRPSTKRPARPETPSSDR